MASECFTKKEGKYLTRGLIKAATLTGEPIDVRDRINRLEDARDKKYF